MKRLAIALSAACMLIGSTAYAQNLSDRIDYFMKKRAQAEANNTAKSEMLSALLYTDLTVEFRETAARDALNYLQTVIGVNIVGRYNDDRTGIGIDPEAPINLDMQDKPALDILELVLDQCQTFGDECTWQLRRGYVEVGTKERLGARNAQEIRYYPIADMLFEVPMFDNAPDLDIGSALNQGGNQGGGGGGGGGSGGGSGGGGSGGGGGGGSGGGGGGGLFDTPEEGPGRISEIEKAQAIMDLILETVEPDAWDVNGGSAATMRYYQGVLIIRAPDFVHRQVGGYPFPTRPIGRSLRDTGRRTLSFSGLRSDIEIADVRPRGDERDAQVKPADRPADKPGG